jgi:propionaldehyde dehydrogenase
MAENALVEQLVKDIIVTVQSKAGATSGGSTGYAGVFVDMNDAVEACWRAQKEFMKCSMADRERFVQAIRQCARDVAEEVSIDAIAETGMGRLGDRITKNLLVANQTPGTEDLVAEALTGDNGLTLFEMSPFGVIGAIAPTTNPTETLINNSIGMLAAGNGVVFSPHPTARKVSLKMIDYINRALMAAGAPQNLVVCVENPTLESTEAMMKHPKVTMLVATGGPGVVKTVLSSGKKAIGAGAGNPPAVVDETANIEKAALDIIHGASFDNNLPCIAEKEVLVVEQVADYLKFCMEGSGLTYWVTDPVMLKKLEDLLVQNNAANKAFVGRDPQYIMKAIGYDLDPKIRLIMMDVPFEHPFVQHELMMPVLAFVRVKDFADACAKAIAVEHGFRHTAIMHSRNVEHLSYLAKAIQTTIFVKNAPSYAGIGVGGEGYTCFTIAGPTGEGLTSARTFTRKRRCVLADSFNIR